MNKKERDSLLTRLRGIKETIEKGSGDLDLSENNSNPYHKLDELLGEKYKKLEETFTKRLSDFVNGEPVLPSYFENA